ncbi:MAG: FAD:protein FMN transferase [Thermoguttaceae bacterium]|nr:FAD:protein FMN transferase [Thermoguttaceae bacterium]
MCGLILGGSPRGYAIDEALETMRILGVSRALVDAGGDVGVGDPPPGKKGWTIGVASIREGEGPTEFWTLANCGIANSGDMYQYVEIGGKRYSHIVDPKTGLGLTDRLSVSVIAPTAADADALASAFSVLGPEKGVRLAESLEGVQTLIHRLTEDGEVRRFSSLPSALPEGTQPFGEPVR